MTVYLLAYDDGETYHVHGVFSTEELAEAAKKVFEERTWLVIAEFEVDPQVS